MSLRRWSMMSLLVDDEIVVKISSLAEASFASFCLGYNLILKKDVIIEYSLTVGYD